MTFDNSITITDGIQVLVAIVNIYLVWLVYKLTRKDINPKLYIKPLQRKPKNNIDTDEEIYESSFDKYVNSEILDLDFDQRGFPDDSLKHSSIIWEIEIHNSSEFIATNIELDYEFTIKKAEMEFGIDELDIVSVKYVPFKTIKRKYNLEYLAPNDKKVIKVLYLLGEFTKADLRVNTLRSNESIFIDSPILLDVYEHPDFYYLDGSHHYRSLLGSYKEPK